MQPHSKSGFTLVELLTVLAIVALLAAIAIPSIIGFTSSGRINQTVSDLAGMIEQGRQYAVAQNTYVWVAFAPVVVNNIDHLNVALIASADGTDPGAYPVGGALTTFSVPNVASPALNLISKVRMFQQVELQEAGGYTSTFNTVAATLPTPATTSANALSPNATFNIVLPGGGVTTTPFNVSFEFTPSGQALQGPYPIDVIEFGLQPAITTTANTSPNVAVMRVNALTGQTSVYRP